MESKKIKMYEVKTREQLDELKSKHKIVSHRPLTVPCFVYSKETKDGTSYTSASLKKIKENEHGSYSGMEVVLYDDWSKDSTIVKSVKEQIEFAKSYIGKKIKSTYGVIGHVTGIRVETIEDYVKTYKERNGNLKFANLQKLSNDEHGVVVSFIGEWESRFGPATMILPIYQGYSDYEDLPSINSFPCEDKGDYYQWGCAKIGKDTLLSARMFLSLSEETGCNRKPESVMIGEGKFTLDILNRLKLG